MTYLLPPQANGAKVLGYPLQGSTTPAPWLTADEIIPDLGWSFPRVVRIPYTGSEYNINELVLMFSSPAALTPWMERAQAAKDQKDRRSRIRNFLAHTNEALMVSSDAFRVLEDAVHITKASGLFFVSPGANPFTMTKELLHYEGLSELEAVEGFLSAKARRAIVEAFEARFGEMLDQVSLADLGAFLSQAIRRKNVLRLHLGYRRTEHAVPSTEFWVHCFVLWTGVSPPVVVTPTLPLTPIRTGGHNVPYFRFQSSRHCRGHLGRRACAQDGQGRPLHHQSPARRARSGRYQRLCRADQHGRPPYRSGLWQVGHQLRLDRRRS